MVNRFLHIKRTHLFAMQRHINHEAPLEACGFLGGKNNHVELILPVKNAAESPVRFRMDPRAQLRAMQQIESEGMEIVGIFHSHPKGPSTPSPTDIQESAYPVINVIWSKAGRRWQTRAFWIENNGFEEVPFNIEDV